MAAHHIEAGRIQFRDDEEAPLQPCCVVALRFGDQRLVRCGVGARQIRNDGGTFTNAEVAVLKQRHFLPRIELGIFGGFGFAGSRADCLRLVFQIEFVQRPMRPYRAAGSNTP